MRSGLRLLNRHSRQRELKKRLLRFYKIKGLTPFIRMRRDSVSVFIKLGFSELAERIMSVDR
jgi:hypothetical protein